MQNAESINNLHVGRFQRGQSLCVECFVGFYPVRDQRTNHVFLLRLGRRSLVAGKSNETDNHRQQKAEPGEF